MRRGLRWGAHWRRTGREDRGAAAVEFALVVPILILLVVAVISFGYMLSFRQALSQAAAEGSRAAAVRPAGTGNAERTAAALAAINDALASYDVSCSAGGALSHGSGASGTCTIDIGACSSGPAGAECARVTLAYPYSSNPLIPGLGVNAILPDNLVYKTEVRVS